MNSLMPVDERTAKEIIALLPADIRQAINLTVIRQGFLKNKSGEIYVRRPGLLMFMEMKFRGKARYSIKALPPTPEEEAQIRHMMGIPEDKPFVVMKGIVRIEYEDGKEEVFEDFGTASPEDTYHGRLLEMAATRATNRAMRLATSLGFTSAEELPHEKTVPVDAKVQFPEDIPFEELPRGKQIEILTKTDELFKEIAELESEVRGEDLKPEQIKQEFLEMFGAESRKQLSYGELRRLWNSLIERKRELARLKGVEA